MPQRLIGWLKSLAPQELRGGRPFVLSEHFQQTRHGVTTPEVRGGGQNRGPTFWVLSRACYAVKFLDLGAVPVSKRDSAINLAIAGWRPFTNTAHYVIPDGQAALLCAWDADTTTQLIGAQSPAAAQVRAVPESALRRASETTTALAGTSQTKAELHQALEGCVGVVTLSGSGGRSLAEQWWPDAPTTPQWRNFLRSAGLGDETNTIAPAPINKGWGSQPRGYQANETNHTSSPREVLALSIAAFLLALPTLWYANELRQIYVLKQDASQRLQSTEKDLDVVLGARELALSTQDRAMQLGRLLNKTDPLALFEIVNNIVLQNSASGALQLGDWDLRSQQLKFSLVAASGSPPAATALVKALERVPIFRDVEAKTDGGRVNITLQVVAPQAGAIPASVAPAGPAAVPGAKVSFTSPVYLYADLPDAAQAAPTASRRSDLQTVSG